jgi:protein-S-isoprenylcysteine O-methyltransferase Ste14
VIRINPIAATLLGLAAGGCAMSFDASHLGVPVTMASAATSSPTTGTPFRVNRHPVFIGWGLITVGTPNIEDVLAGQVANGAGVTNLKIRVRARWSDLLITGLTLGFFSPRTVTLEGTVQSAAAPVSP